MRNKTSCALIRAVSLKTCFNNFSIPSTETLFDPRVVYDRLHGRCLVSAESRNSASGNTDQFLYIAASLTSSCTTWRRIRFVLSRASTGSRFCKAAQSDFYDYPSIGYMGTRMVVTANVFPKTGGYGTIMSIDLTALLGTSSISASCFRTGLPTNIQPAIVSSAAVTQMFLLSPGSGSGSSISRRRLNVSASGPGSDTLTTLSSIGVAAWTAPPDAKQPNGQNLDTLDGRFQSATKQIGSKLWNVHAINVGGFSRWQLYKFSTSGTSPLFTFTPTTTTCANADHLFNPSVDTNSTASGTLAYVTASRTCPSQATAGRAAHLVFRGNNSSSAGWVFTTIETSTTNFATESANGSLVACNTAAPPAKTCNSCRWGNYSATQIDPSNTARAWGFNQLVTGTRSSNWNTRAGLVGP